MKNLLYFLLSFAFVLFLGLYNIVSAYTWNGNAFAARNNITCDIYYQEPGEGSQDVVNRAGGAYHSYMGAKSTLVSDFSDNIQHFTSVRLYSAYYNSGGGFRVVLFDGGSNYEGITVPDADADGVADKWDLYPNDSNSYKFAVISYIENTATGEKVQYTVKTDRGDIFTYGDKPDDMSGYMPYINVNPSFVDASQAENLFPDFTASTYNNDNVSSDSSDASNDYYQVTNEILSNDETVPAGSDPNMQSGTSSDSSDSDTQSLQKIVNNTKSSSENIARLGDYLDSINNKLKNIDAKQTIANSSPSSVVVSGGDTSGGSSLTQDDVKNAVQDANSTTEDDKNNALSSAGNTDTVYNQAVSSINGNVDLSTDAPAEYQQKTDIVSKMQDYISNNPLSDIFSNTQVTTVGAVDTIYFPYNGKQIPLTVKGFEPELQAFGSVLLAFSTLSGMMLIFRG